MGLGTAPGGGAGEGKILFHNSLRRQYSVVRTGNLQRVSYSSNSGCQLNKKLNSKINIHYDSKRYLLYQLSTLATLLRLRKRVRPIIQGRVIMNSIMFAHRRPSSSDYKVRPPPRRLFNNEAGLSYAFEAVPRCDCTEPGKYARALKTAYLKSLLDTCTLFLCFSCLEIQPGEEGVKRAKLAPTVELGLLSPKE